MPPQIARLRASGPVGEAQPLSWGPSLGLDRRQRLTVRPGRPGELEGVCDPQLDPQLPANVSWARRGGQMATREISTGPWHVRHTFRMGRLISPLHGGSRKIHRLPKAACSSFCPTEHLPPQLTDHHLVRADVPRGASPQSPGQPSGKIALTQPNTPGTNTLSTPNPGNLLGFSHLEKESSRM